MATTTSVSGAALHAFIQHRSEPGERLYVVVDAARDGALAFAARDDFGLDARWLFQGSTPQPSDTPSGGRPPGLSTFERDFAGRSQAKMAEVAPYLVPVPMAPRYPYPDCGFLDRWAQRLGGSAGIMLLTNIEPEPLVRHLRTLFYATGEKDERYYFRFYDPRVLRAFLPTCTAAEAKKFFGPIRCFLVESEKTGSMWVVRPDRSGVELKEDVWGASAESGSPGRPGR